MFQAGIVDHVSTTDYTYVVGQTKGPIYGPGGPAEFLHELTRTVFYLPTINAIFLCDRISVDDPQVVTPGLGGYQQTDATAIRATTNWVEQVWHAQTQPSSLVGSKLATVSWLTGGGQHCELDAFSTTSPLTVDIVDERILWAGVSSIDPDEKKWQFRVRPVTNGNWDTILAVWRLNPSANVSMPLMIAGMAGFSIDGVNVFFGVAQGSRLFNPTLVAGVPAGKNYFVGCAGAQPVVAN